MNLSTRVAVKTPALKEKAPRMKIVPELIWVAVAVFGGVAKGLSDFIKEGSAPLRAAHIIANAVIGGFSGYMFAQVAILMQPEWVIVAAGVGGAMGAQAIELIVLLAKKKFKYD